MDHIINVTQPSLPPLDELIPLLREVWDSKQLTNGGPMSCRLEEALARHLGVSQVALSNNGTSALIAALAACNLQGEVITTPLSFIATAHAIRWCGLTPVFADIDPETLNLDPTGVERAITDRTAAILPVHCYGRPCDVDAMARVAASRGLRLIYDAAHAFGVRDAGGSVLRHGDLSVLSFHATKVFNTLEGGAVVCASQSLRDEVARIQNFGLLDPLTVSSLGFNGKMHEVTAAVGLLQLKYVDQAIERRRERDTLYRKLLRDAPGIRCLEYPTGLEANYSYFPVLVTPDYRLSRDALHQELARHGFFTRRYFFPLISNQPPYATLPSAAREHLPVSNAIADSILCLPIYEHLPVVEIERLCELIVP